MNMEYQPQEDRHIEEHDRLDDIVKVLAKDFDNEGENPLADREILAKVEGIKGTLYGRTIVMTEYALLKLVRMLVDRNAEIERLLDEGGNINETNLKEELDENNKTIIMTESNCLNSLREITKGLI